MIKRQKSKNGDVRVTFSLPINEAPEATSVLGDFNGWDPNANPMQKRSNGTRSAAIDVPAGEVLQFKYLADGGRWFTDRDTDLDGDGNNILAA